VLHALVVISGTSKRLYAAIAPSRSVRRLLHFVQTAILENEQAQFIAPAPRMLPDSHEFAKSINGPFGKDIPNAATPFATEARMMLLESTFGLAF
jgi:hypothetical protein